MKPLSYNLWIVVIFVAILMAFVFTLNETYFKDKHQEFIMFHYLTNLWVAAKSNFGGKPGSFYKRNSYQLMLFVCLLTGSVIWIGYRASITSELSVSKKELPFHDLESLSQSDYK